MDAERGNKPIIVSCVSDLIFETKINLAVDSLGYKLISNLDLEQLDFDGKFWGNRLRSDQQVIFPFIGFLIQTQPGLIIFDLNDQEIDWEFWMIEIKKDPATMRIPVLAFGSHVNSVSLNLARESGADRVVARSYFSSHTSELIKDLAVTLDAEVFVEFCLGKLPEKAIYGLELFNHGEYFEAHELLEEAWNEEPSIGRNFYKAVLQISVAFLHIERGNYRGAIKMFNRTQQWLLPLPDYCLGVDLGFLKEEVEKIRQEITLLGPERILEFSPSNFCKIKYIL